jgi:hypothetical protein
MSGDTLNTVGNNASENSARADMAPENEHKGANKKKEIGGRDGPDPTRFGDWEKDGRCIDF